MDIINNNIDMSESSGTISNFVCDIPKRKRGRPRKNDKSSSSPRSQSEPPREIIIDLLKDASWVDFDKIKCNITYLGTFGPSTHPSDAR